MRIVPGAPEHTEDCIEAVTRSGIGEAHFRDRDATRETIEYAIDSGELQVALDDGSRAAGLIWTAERGAFGSFPYLRLIAVREDLRGRGIGSRLMDHFEEQGFARRPRVFLLVSDFNSGAQRFYERRGYTQVGAIPDMFIEGVTELIMMKVRP